MNFSSSLISWYLNNKRDLPWRNTNNPYFIWLSEVILQQTRVDQGRAYYLRFIKEFPTVQKLASAPEQKVLKIWQGLGYYSRARNLHAAARFVVSDLKGKFPQNHEELLRLPGVGPYTAAAVSSIAFNLPHAVVDGNVYRVLARIFGLKTPIDSSLGKKEFQQLASELLDSKKPSLHNQALMEFGALYCKPANPACSECIFSNSCLAFSQREVQKLPVKEKTTRVRKRYFNYLVIRQHGEKIKTSDTELILKKRTAKDIWENLYDFPLIETGKQIAETDLIKSNEWKKMFGGASLSVASVSQPFKHQLTHQQIFARFWEIRTKKPMPVQPGWIRSTAGGLRKFPVPRLIENYMKSRKIPDS